MNKKEPGLEAFFERHRADFDAFEPRPDLWNDIEQRLGATPDEAPTLRISPPTMPATGAVVPAKRPPVRYALAAALALLLVAGLAYVGYRPAASEANWTRQPLVQHPATPEPGPAATQEALLATAATESPAQRLLLAVRHMETYYAAQLTERQRELHQLEATLPVSAGTANDWQKELAALDSTYQQLRLELHRNPEPDVVLDAMNRNLQIRLDILNQQLRTREQMQQYHAPLTEKQPQP